MAKAARKGRRLLTQCPSVAEPLEALSLEGMPQLCSLEFELMQPSAASCSVCGCVGSSGAGGSGGSLGGDGGVGGSDGGGDTDLSMAVMSAFSSSTVTPRAAEVALAEPKEVAAVPTTAAAAEEFSTLMVKTRLTLAAVMASETSDGAMFSVVAMLVVSLACASSP